MARRERRVQRHGVEPAVGREPPGEVHLVALAGAEQLEDGVDAGFEVVAIETRPPLAARRTRPIGERDRRPVEGQVGGGALEQAAAVAVAAHRRPSRRGRPPRPPRSARRPHRGQNARRATPTSGPPARARARARRRTNRPTDPASAVEEREGGRRRSPRRPRRDRRRRACACPRRHDGRAGIAGEPRQERGRDRVGEAHRFTVPPVSRRSRADNALRTRGAGAMLHRRRAPEIARDPSVPLLHRDRHSEPRSAPSSGAWDLPCCCACLSPSAVSCW